MNLACCYAAGWSDFLLVQHPAVTQLRLQLSSPDVWFATPYEILDVGLDLSHRNEKWSTRLQFLSIVSTLGRPALLSGRAQRERARESVNSTGAERPT
ncbi:unnamed protein product [Prunus armeniaca]|uniref:Uncharacterized protein n=1 Tax=Prunus armeniaca TaxID=36596 RepID=A0A6J5Y9X9_PRUAR|nr:unnamed protein product [Prunus armeniaca]